MPIGLKPPGNHDATRFDRIQFVNVDRVNESKLGHSYLVSAPTVLQDIDVVLSGGSEDKRQIVEESKRLYWLNPAVKMKPLLAPEKTR